MDENTRDRTVSTGKVDKLAMARQPGQNREERTDNTGQMDRITVA